MSHSEFAAVLGRVNFSAGVLAATGNQHAALADAEVLAQRLEHYVALSTPLPFSPQPTSDDTFSPFASPTISGVHLQPFTPSSCDGSFFANYYAQQPPPLLPPPPQVKPKRPKAQANEIELKFSDALSFGYDNPPPHPNRHDLVRTDRPPLYVLPKGAPDVPASMYPRRSAKKRASSGAKKPTSSDAG